MEKAFSRQPRLPQAHRPERHDRIAWGNSAPSSRISSSSEKRSPTSSASISDRSLRRPEVLLSRPCVLTCWGSDILVDLPASRGLGFALRRAALAKAARITCDSDEVFRAIVSAAPAAAATAKIIFWGIDTELFRSPEPERRAGLAVREELGIPANAVLLLSNRLAAPNYGIKEIIERFDAGVRDENTHLLARFQPGADPGYVQACKAIAAGNGRIHYLERPLADAEMPALYAACDIVLHFPPQRRHSGKHAGGTRVRLRGGLFGCPGRLPNFGKRLSYSEAYPEKNLMIPPLVPPSIFVPIWRRNAETIAACTPGKKRWPS